MKSENLIDRFLRLIELGYSTKSAYTQLTGTSTDSDTQKRLELLQAMIMLYKVFSHPDIGD